MGRPLNFPCPGNNYCYTGEDTVTESEGSSESSRRSVDVQNDVSESGYRQSASSQPEDSAREQVDTENGVSADEVASSVSEYRAGPSGNANVENAPVQYMEVDNVDIIDEEYVYIEEVVLEESGPNGVANGLRSPFGDDCYRLLDSSPAQDFRFLRRRPTAGDEKYLNLEEKRKRKALMALEVVLMHHLVDSANYNHPVPTPVELDRWLAPIEGDWNGSASRYNVSDVVALQKFEYEGGIKTLTRMQYVRRADLGRFLLDPRNRGYSICEYLFHQKFIKIQQVFRSLLQNVSVMAPIVTGSLTAYAIAEQEFREQSHTASVILDPFTDSEGMQFITYRAIVEMIHCRLHSKPHSWREMSSLFWPLANQVRYLKYVKSFLRRILHPTYHEACVNIMVGATANTVPREIFRQIPLRLPFYMQARYLALDRVLLKEERIPPPEDAEEKKIALRLTKLWGRKYIVWLEKIMGWGLTRG